MFSPQSSTHLNQLSYNNGSFVLQLLTLTQLLHSHSYISCITQWSKHMRCDSIFQMHFNDGHKCKNKLCICIQIKAESNDKTKHSLLACPSLGGGRSYFERRRTGRCSVRSSGERDLAVIKQICTIHTEFKLATPYIENAMYNIDNAATDSQYLLITIKNRFNSDLHSACNTHNDTANTAHSDLWLLSYSTQRKPFRWPLASELLLTQI